MSGRLHALVFGGGLLLLFLGVAGWTLHGGPETLEDVVLVLDLTIGGTILCTAALVGRARAAEVRRTGQLGVLQHAAHRMSASLTREDVGRAVVEETRRVIDYHNARVYLLEPPDDLVPVAFEGRVGAYEKVDLDILRTRIGPGFHGLGRRAPHPTVRWGRPGRPARDDDSGHGRRRRVDGGRADAVRRCPGRRHHAVQAGAPPVRRGGRAAAVDPRRPGCHRIHQCLAPRRGPAPRARAASPAGDEQRPLAVARPGRRGRPAGRASRAGGWRGARPGQRLGRCP